MTTTTSPTTMWTKLIITLVAGLTACGGVAVQRETPPFLPSRRHARTLSRFR